MTSQNKRTGRAFALSAALVLALAPAIAEARAGKGGSSGFRGSRTQSAAPPTATAPGATQPFQRSATPAPGAASTARPSAGAAAPAAGGMFSSPLARGIMGGLLGAGLFGLLSGSGLFSGLGGLASMFGLLLQVALIGGLAWLALSWWRRRQQPAPAAAGYERMSGGANPPPPAPDAPRSAMTGNAPMGAPAGMAGGLGGALGGLSSRLGGGASAGGFGSQTAPLKLDGADFETFEKLLGEVQAAYANEDFGHLRRISTPEMFGYFEEDIADQNAKGLMTKSAGVKLLQGDLSEAWSENSGDYATVAMRYEMVDALVDRATNRVVEGDLVKPQEVVEIWTFVRGQNTGPQGWILSAIQQPE